MCLQYKINHIIDSIRIAILHTSIANKKNHYYFLKIWFIYF